MFLRFFFSSRRRHTRYWRDWSSDVCSSDLVHGDRDPLYPVDMAVELYSSIPHSYLWVIPNGGRSEERRVGKEWRSRWTAFDIKEKKTVTSIILMKLIRVRLATFKHLRRCNR